MGPMKECARCTGWFDSEVFFGRKNRRYASLLSGTKPICLGCEQEVRDEKKIANRWGCKIRDTTRRHARKKNIPVKELIDRFDWNFDRMMRDAQSAYEGGCSYCGGLYSLMGHGLS